MRTLTLGALTLALAAGAARSTPAQANPSGLRGDLIAQFDQAADKILQLAQAIPQDKYTWRPGAGVRSVSEVFMHVAGGNYFILTFAGVKAPDGMTEDAGAAITDRAQVMDNLKRSFDFVRAAIRGVPDADLDKPTDLFGQHATYRSVYVLEVAHIHEHLGQLIAYARMNGVVPPWSMATR